MIDFDAAVRDPSDPSRLNPAYDGSDHLHFSLAGYRAMADAVNLSQLRLPACPLSRLRVRVRPKSVIAGRFARVSVRVSAPVSGHLRAVSGASVVLDGHRARTRTNGLATLRLALRRPGTWRVRASAKSYLPASATIRATRRSNPSRHRASSPPPLRTSGLG